MTPVTWTRKWPGGRGGGGPCAFTRLRQRLEKLSGFEEIICMFYLQFRWRPETRNVFVKRWHMSLFPQCKEYDQFDLVFQKSGDNPQDLLSLHRPLVWCIIKWRSPQGSRLRTWPKPGCNTKFLSNSRSFENVLTRPFLNICRPVLYCFLSSIHSSSVRYKNWLMWHYTSDNVINSSILYHTKIWRMVLRLKLDPCTKV